MSYLPMQKATIATVGSSVASTASAYAVNTVIGGVITFSGALPGGGSALLDAINISLKTLGVAPTLYAFVFGKAPTGTYTDFTTFNLSATDVPLAVFVTSPVWFNCGAGGSFGTALGLGGPAAVLNQAAANNLYVVLVAGSAFTPTSTSDIAAVTAITEPK